MDRSIISVRHEGLYFAPGNFFLDPQHAVETAVVSHAHADHFVNGHKTVYCTTLTYSLISQRIRNYYGRVITSPFHHTFELNGCKITFIPAGHILGSAQVLIEHNDVRYLFTGDFKLTPDKSCEPFEITRADVLLTECTFGSEGLQHPDCETEIRKLNIYNDINFVIGVYALGKAQRIVQLINEHCPGKKIMVHKNIAVFNKAYERSGINLGTWMPYDRHAFRRERDIIYLLPPAHSKSFYPQPWYLRAFASGWDHLQAESDLKLFISDHADWFDLLKIIENTEAKVVYTLHGDGRQLKAHLNNKNVEVINLY